MPWCWVQAPEHPKGEIPREIRDLIPAEGMGGCSFIRDTGRGQGWVERAQTLPGWAGPVGGEASSSHSLFSSPHAIPAPLHLLVFGIEGVFTVNKQEPPV